MTKNNSTPNEAPNRKHRPTRMNAEEVRAVLPDYKDTGASIPQARFAACYVTNGFNGRKAYKDAVSHNAKNSTADAKAHAWLRNPKVMACIQQFTETWLSDCRMKLEGEIIRTLWAQAFYDPSTFVTPSGEVAFDNWDEVPTDLRRAIEGIETKYFGKDADISTTTIKMADRGRALQQLSQYISLMQGANANLNLNVTPETELLLRSLFNRASPVGKNPRGNPNVKKGESSPVESTPFKRGG